MPLKDAQARKRAEVICLECGVPFMKRIDLIKDSGQNYCSLSCGVKNAREQRNQRCLDELQLVKSGEIKNKPCKSCGESKPFSEYHKSPTEKYGLRSKCKLCRSKAADKEKVRNYNMRKYGITLAHYSQMLKTQNGCCLICKDGDKKLFVDHSHVTKEVRGLLCHQCNAGIGMFRENPIILQNAIKYIGG